MTSTLYRINQPSVAQETIEGEAIIINLVSGNYYSLDSVGTEVWQLVEQGVPVEGIADTLEASYNANGKASIRSALDQLVAELLREELIVADDTGTPQGPPSTTFPAGGPGTRRAFTTPVLNTFTDLQDLLLIDPIHEVDEAGWPTSK